MSERARIEEIPDDEEVRGGETGSESEGEHTPVNNPAVASTSASSSKKKKKKKSKALKVAQQILGGSSKQEIPQEVVDAVSREVKAQHGNDAPGTDPEAIRKAMEQLKMMDFLKGKTAMGGKNKKEMGEHKFWKTQPVPQLGEGAPSEDGFIEESRPVEEVRQEPFPLPKDFEWVIVDTTDPAELKELYELLSANYVEDDDATFRFNYSAEFLHWALQPPGWHKEWHLGVRVSSNRKLVAFISGIPLTLRVRNNTIPMAEVNFLCVHKKLRSKRLAPVLIKELTRRVHLKGLFQAIYTAGVLIPTPVSSCRYFHRSLNIPKLVDVRFTTVPRNSTLARMIKLNALPEDVTIKGLREMEDKDVVSVTKLYAEFMGNFDMVPEMDENEIRHQLLSGRGTGSLQDGRREGQVVWSYVVEDPATHEITDFFSFYNLPSSIIGNPKHNHLDAAYLFYYGSKVASQEDAEAHGLIKRRLCNLMTDALRIAYKAKFDVFNALTLMYNPMFLEELKFGAGDGLLNYYLYNWRITPLAGVVATGDRPIGRGVGVVML